MEIIIFSFQFQERKLPIFSTSDRIYQMCYCCRKLDFHDKWERMRERMHARELSLVKTGHMISCIRSRIRSLA